MNAFFLERTVNHLPIPAYQFGRLGPSVLILGGIHGDEREGIEAAYGLIRRWSQGFAFQLQVCVVPILNIDGAIRHQRVNANGVDLNRNMATKDWSADWTNPRYKPGPFANSEPETKALLNLLERLQPSFICSLHSWHPVLNVNGDCRLEALAIARRTGYRIDDSIGYPTPGCLGTYCGLERKTPTLTYEIERGIDPLQIEAIHLPAIEEALKVTETTRKEKL